MNEIYVSTDVETDGPCPGLNSMLSFGSVALTIKDDKCYQLGTFYKNLNLLPGANPDKSTMNFWKSNKDAYNLTRVDTVDPLVAIQEYHSWLTSLPGKPVFVGYPAGFDFTFIYYYLHRFAGDSPFSFSALDIKTYAMAVMKTEYRQSTKKNMPKRWFPKLPHTHHALDDALEQGHLFLNILMENNNK